VADRLTDILKQAGDQHPGQMIVRLARLAAAAHQRAVVGDASATPELDQTGSADGYQPRAITPGRLASARRNHTEVVR
jgi:hypothetical protein